MMKVILDTIGCEALTLLTGLAGVLAFVVLNALVLTWAERKVAGHMQRRIGPRRSDRTGWFSRSRMPSSCSEKRS